MKFLDTFYKTKNLARNGIFILVATVVLFLLGKLFIPEIKPLETKQQIVILNGFNLKHNDNPEVSQFLQSIIQNEGYLCMGTSESTSLNDKNYYDYLNHDHGIENDRFSLEPVELVGCIFHYSYIIEMK